MSEPAVLQFDDRKVLNSSYSVELRVVNSDQLDEKEKRQLSINTNCTNYIGYITSIVQHQRNVVNYSNQRSLEKIGKTIVGRGAEKQTLYTNPLTRLFPTMKKIQQRSTLDNESTVLRALSFSSRHRWRCSSRPTEKTDYPLRCILIPRTVIRFFSSLVRERKPSMPKRTAGVDSQPASQPASQFRNEGVSIVVSFRYRGKSSAIESAVTRNAVNCRVWTSILIRFFH